MPNCCIQYSRPAVLTCLTQADYNLWWKSSWYFSKTTACWASSVGCRHNAARICCWAPPLLLWIDGTDRQMNGRTRGRYIDSASHTLLSSSIIFLIYPTTLFSSSFFLYRLLTESFLSEQLHSLFFSSCFFHYLCFYYRADCFKRLLKTYLFVHY